jgi:hypothetical protein
LSDGTKIQKHNSHPPLCAKTGFVPFITRDANRNNVATPQYALQVDCPHRTERATYCVCLLTEHGLEIKFQSKVLRTITNAPWYVSNYTLHNDLQIPFITVEIKRYYNRLIGHENSYVTELRNPLNVRRRLKRQWPSDLKDQREEKE